MAASTELRDAPWHVRGAEEHGLFTTAKHFTGHGDTETDSHAALPTLP